MGQKSRIPCAVEPDPEHVQTDSREMTRGRVRLTGTRRLRGPSYRGECSSCWPHSRGGQRGPVGSWEAVPGADVRQQVREWSASKTHHEGMDKIGKVPFNIVTLCALAIPVL
ncbi:unnamed protein product [Gadus morhua 'NCC']